MEPLLRRPDPPWRRARLLAEALIDIKKEDLRLLRKLPFWVWVTKNAQMACSSKDCVPCRILQICSSTVVTIGIPTAASSPHVLILAE